MITFVANFYRDTDIAMRLARGLRYFFPQAPILFIGDGVPIPEGMSDLVATYQGDRLKHLATGQWTERYLRAALALGNTDYILKLDPDTCIWRRFYNIPDADWFGSLNNSKQFIRGGAVAVSQVCAQKLVHSGILQMPSPYTYERYKRFRWPHEEETNECLSCQDQIVSEAMRHLNVQPTEWKEVNILGNDNVVPEPGSYALTHPHPTIMVPAICD